MTWQLTTLPLYEVYGFPCASPTREAIHFSCGAGGKPFSPSRPGHTACASPVPGSTKYSLHGDSDLSATFMGTIASSKNRKEEPGV